MFQFWVNWNDEIRTLHVNELYEFLKILFRSFGLLWKLSSSLSYQTVLSESLSLAHIGGSTEIRRQQNCPNFRSATWKFHPIWDPRFSSQFSEGECPDKCDCWISGRETVRNLPPVPSNTMVFHQRIVSGLICKPSIIVFWLRLFWVGPVHSNL